MPRNKYPEETREKVMDAGLRTFQEKGYEASTILDIVANMDGLTRGAFYHHFKSKEELLSALCERMFNKSNPFKKVLADKNLSGLKKLQKALKINMSPQYTDFAVLFDAANALYKSPQFIMWNMEFSTKLGREYVRPLIEEGIADGSIKKQDPQILSELFVVMFTFWLGSPFFTGDADYLQRKAIAVFTVLEQSGLSLYDDEIDELGQMWIDNELK